MVLFNQTMLPRWLTAAAVLAALAAAPAARAETAPDALIQQISTEVLDAIKADKAVQSGDLAKVNALVDAKVMPYVNFQKMTASAVGRPWLGATPEQRQRLQTEFKALLVRTYAGAVSQVKNQTIRLKPQRQAAPADTEVVVRSEVRGKGDPIQLDYRMEKTDAGWKIFDVNVGGMWLVEQYKADFAQRINAGGIDGLISSLAEKNKTASAQ